MRMRKLKANWAISPTNSACVVGILPISVSEPIERASPKTRSERDSILNLIFGGYCCDNSLQKPNFLVKKENFSTYALNRYSRLGEEKESRGSDFQAHFELIALIEPTTLRFLSLCVACVGWELDQRREFSLFFLGARSLQRLPFSHGYSSFSIRTLGWTKR